MNTENTENLFNEIDTDLEVIEISVRALQARVDLVFTTIHALKKCIRADYSGIVNQQQLRDQEIKELKEKLNG